MDKTLKLLISTKDANMKETISIEEVDHSNLKTILGKTILMVHRGSLCPSVDKCKFCDALVARILSRIGHRYNELQTYAFTKFIIAK